MKTAKSLGWILLLASSTFLGCAETSGDSRSLRRNNPLDDVTTPSGSASHEEEAKNTTTKIRGRLSSEGSGTTGQGLAGHDLLAVANTVEIAALANDGTLIPVTEVNVQPGGAFEAQVPTATSPTGIFIMKVKDVVGAVVGSGVVNGLPAFVQAFFIDATVDTVTSFKANILVTLAKKGIPGVQNYLNVINAFVDAELANSIALVGVVATDLNSLIKATSEAVIAAENVVLDALAKAGLPIDASAFLAAQASVASGAQNLVTTTAATLISSSKSLIASLEAATKAAAAPIDLAIFNAVVNGTVAFDAIFKQSLQGTAFAGHQQLGFSSSKSLFELTSTLAADATEKLFEHATPEVLAAVKQAADTFKAKVHNAASAKDLEAAKAAFQAALLGSNGDNNPQNLLQMLSKAVANLIAIANDVKAKLDPLAQSLQQALVGNANPDLDQIADALSKFDTQAAALAASLQKALDAGDAKALADALNASSKVVVL